MPVDALLCLAPSVVPQDSLVSLKYAFTLSLVYNTLLCTCFVKFPFVLSYHEEEKRNDFYSVKYDYEVCTVVHLTI